MAKRTVNLRQLKEDAESVVTNTDDATTNDRTPVVSRKMTFPITYDAPNGETYTDDLHSIILNSDGRLTKTRVFNSLTQGMIASSLPESEQLRLEALARLVTQLDDAPDWVTIWAGEDMELLSEINAVLVRHENAYFRGNNRTGENGTFKPRVSIDTSTLDKTGLTIT